MNRQSIKPSQLMDQSMWNFKNLEHELITENRNEADELFSAEEFETSEES